MNKIQIIGLFLNFIIYLIMICPIIIICFKKKIYENKSIFISHLINITVLEIILSIVLYAFSRKIFDLFTNTTGIINYAIYASKILFISSSLYGIKFMIPAYLFFSNKGRKKTAIIFLSKIAVAIIFAFIGYSCFNFKGILYSIPLCDLIYYIIYIILIIFN